jgi:hypothetical protein
MSDRFEIVNQECMTQCECPESLCTHQPDGYRFYYVWIVWDIPANEHAFITEPRHFTHEYDRKRDALAAIKAFEESHAP